MAGSIHDGVPMRLAGREFVVAPLTLGQLKRLAPKFALLGAIGAAMSEEQIEALVEIAHAALARNAPGLTREEAAELVDLGNAGLLLRAAVGAAGLAPAGEARAGSVSMRSTGTS